MNINQAFPSKYLKEADLNGKPFILTIAKVSMESVDTTSGEIKPVAYFDGTDKGMVLNVTNANNIAALYGQETNDWGGKSIELFPTTTDFQGKTVPCIRIRRPQNQSAAAVIEPVAETETSEEHVAVSGSDSLPF